jgi:Ca-activated chloride channel family protein
MAKATGFRPALSEAEIPIDDMLTKERGVDPKEPKRILQSPPNSAINFIQKIWRENKRPSDIVLAIDISGSMKDDDKILHARKAAEEFIKLLGEVDYLSIALFGTQVDWLIQDMRMDDKGKQATTDAIKHLATGGDTALYYSIKVSHDYLQKRPKNRARAVVVLSDGDDTKAEKGDALILIDPETNRKVRSPSLVEILNQIKNDGENNTIFVYTIGYGTKANKDILSKIAASSRADYYEGRPEDIKKLLSVLANQF